MCIVGETPVHRLMDEIAARRQARRDWSYADELRRLREAEKRAAEINPETGQPINTPYQSGS